MCSNLFFQSLTNQTGGKPQNSVILAVMSSLYVSSTDRKQISVSTTDMKTTRHSQYD